MRYKNVSQKTIIKQKRRAELEPILREKLLRENKYSEYEITKNKDNPTIDVSGYYLSKSGQLKRYQPKAYKLNYKDKSKIRYQLYRDAGYSAKEATALRRKTYLDLTGIRLDKKTGKVIKGRNYKRVRNVIDVDNTMTELRQVDKGSSVFTQHGYLLSSNKYKGRYNDIIQRIRRRDNLTNDQAFYFANHMLQSGYSYEFTRRELLGSREFEIYIQKKHKRK